MIYTTSVSPHATEHAKRHGAVIGDVGHLGPIGIGPLNEKVDPEPIDPNPSNRVAALIYTSGTTGLPKGVMLTHRNLLFVAAVSAKIRSLTPDDRLYGVLPMSHAVGLSVVLLGTLLSGATLYLAPRFDPMRARGGTRAGPVDGRARRAGHVLSVAAICEVTRDRIARVSRRFGSFLLPALHSTLQSNRRSKACSAWCCTTAMA